MVDSIQKLKYRLIEATSEDQDYPLHELLRGIDSTGWGSVRFCTYPQEILLQFLTPVRLKQINILSNERKISSLIELYCFYPLNQNELFSNYKHLTFEKLGYIRMDTNSKTNYKAREFRKIYVDVDCLYLKLVLNKNYVNKYNVFNQVGLINIDFYGTPYLMNKNELFLKESLKDRITEVKDDEMDEIAVEKLKILRNHQEEALKIEDFDEAKRIKKSIDKIRIIGRKIFEMETQKKIYVNNEDYDNAKIMKLEIERLKSNLKYMDRQLASLVPYSNLSIEFNKSVEYEENKDNNQIINPNDITGIREKSFSIDKEHREKETSFSINTEMNMVERSLFNKTNKSLEKIEEEFQTHDDTIIPAIKRKMNNNIQSLEEFKDESLLKSELEDLDVQIRFTYELFIKYIGEEGLRKLFSKNILWKDEGLEQFNQSLPKMFGESSKNGNEINHIINLIMKMVFTFLNEKHPQVCIKSIEIFESLLIQIQNSKNNLNYDFTVTDKILIKIKEKVGDVNSKVRNRAVELYSFMLKQDSCDYNNLIAELVEEELKHIDSKKILKSSKMILGKLSIFNNVCDDFNNAIKDKRTEMTTFPFVLVISYVIDNINHSKSEVRKLDREILIKMYKIFGYKKLEPYLKKADERELDKLVNEIPELKDLVESLQNDKKNILVRNNSLNNLNKSTRNRSNSKENTSKSNASKTNNLKRKNKSMSPQPKHLICKYCSKIDNKILTEEDLNDHMIKNCLMFTNCIKCKENIELKNYNNHLLNECENKSEFKLCKRCKEAIDIKDYDLHVKDNKCNPGKNQNSQGRCPLCHKDIPPQEKGLQQHLLKDICSKQKRKK